MILPNKIASNKFTLQKFSFHKISFLGIILFSIIRTASFAQETALEELPGIRERAVVLRIVSRIVEKNEKVVWDSENSSITIPGRAVGIKLVGTDIVVAVQFTPFLQPNGRHTLVTQSQIWINVPGEGISYHTTMQTIPLGFREDVYYFPLGSIGGQDGPQIEILLSMEPYMPNPQRNPPGRSRERVNSP